MEIIILSLFVLGYLAITLEQVLGVDKAAFALLSAVLCWIVFITSSHDKLLISSQLIHHLGEIAGIVFFLLGAMVIVELIDLHDGFEVLAQRIKIVDSVKLLWIVSILTFFLSAILDNLTTTIVIISLARKLVSDRQERIFMTGIVIIAANAGGAWSPMGDVTTTMLWIGEQITAWNIVKQLFLPSAVCLLVPLLYASSKMKGAVKKADPVKKSESPKPNPPERNIVFISGLGVLILVPVFKTVTHLPPFMGILFGLALMWIITSLVHNKKPEKDKGFFSVSHALRKADTPSILFFTGILLGVAVLQSSGILMHLAGWLSRSIGNEKIIVLITGLLSGVIDNVPLVAALQGMFGGHYPTDHYFWEFTAYCTGTGGSALIIGSAAGVAAMGMERINFFWYLRRISWLAIMGYFAGAVFYLLQMKL